MDKKAQGWGASLHNATQRVVSDLGGITEAQRIIGKRGEALAMKVVFLIPTKIKERWGTYHSAMGRYDLDNLEKLVMDVIMGKRGSALGEDDGRIAHKEGIKVWCSPPEAKCLVRLHRPLAVNEIIERMLK